MKQIVIWGISNRLGRVIVMLLIAKIKQTMSLVSLNRVKTDQIGGFLSFWGKIAF